MSDSDRPTIDLHGDYDTLERRLSQFLGIPILLVRDWKQPATCSYSRHTDGTEIFESDDPATQELTRRQMQWYKDYSAYSDYEGHKHPGEQPDVLASLESLRANITRRDPALAATLRPEEIESLFHRGHVTLRDGNCTPARAVIVFDAKQSIHSDAELKQTLFSDRFASAWQEGYDQRILYTDFIEGFQVTAKEYRTYKALYDIHYALQHQQEHEHHDKGWYSHPYYYNFARIAHKTPGLHAADYDLPLRDVLNRKACEYSMMMAWEKLGFKENDWTFFDQLKLAGAFKNLMYFNLDPTGTFARLYSHHSHWSNSPFANLNDQKITEYKKCLKTALEDRLRDAGFNKHKSDIRVLVPAFREIKDRLGFDEAGKIYLSTIWESCETFFPTLAAAPMPKIRAPEPPRTVQGYRALTERRPAGTSPAGPAPGM